MNVCCQWEILIGSWSNRSYYVYQSGHRESRQELCSDQMCTEWSRMSQSTSFKSWYSYICTLAVDRLQTPHSVSFCPWTSFCPRRIGISSNEASHHFINHLITITMSQKCQKLSLKMNCSVLSAKKNYTARVINSFLGFYSFFMHGWNLSTLFKIKVWTQLLKK